MKLYDKSGNQIGVQDENGNNYFWKKEDIANPPKYYLTKPKPKKKKVVKDGDNYVI